MAGHIARHEDRISVLSRQRRNRMAGTALAAVLLFCSGHCPAQSANVTVADEVEASFGTKRRSCNV